MRNSNDNSNYALCSRVKTVLDCFHTTAKCVFWILIRNAHFELLSVHMIEVLAYFELRIIHTSDRKCDSPFESVEKRHGCVWVACQSNMHVCCLRFLCMCSARYYKWKWLEGHTMLRPPKHDSEVKSFIHRFRCVICENRNWKCDLCTVIWDAQGTQTLRSCDSGFGYIPNSVFFAYFEF